MTDVDLQTCDREPIHIPGSIQPHGLLLVIDIASDTIIQSAGDAEAILGFSGSVLGHSTRAVLGASLAALQQRAGILLHQVPVYLGSIESRKGVGELVLLGHQVSGMAVLELAPSSWPDDAAQTLAGIRAISERISEAPELIDACRVAASEVARIIGYDRVMIYQFLPDESGAVIVEIKDDRLPTLLNHRFPASDIPAQARQLYVCNPIRVIPCAEYTPAELTPRLNPVTGAPLDMSYSTLRSISPVHLRYLKNMGVGASMSVSLVHRGTLWGLIACHNSIARHVPYQAQEICRHIGQILSQKIAAYEDASKYRQVLELSVAREDVLCRLREDEHPGDLLLDLGPELLPLVSADGVAIVSGDRIAGTGHVPPEAHVRRLAATAREQMPEAGVFATDRLSAHDPEAAGLKPLVSGMLSVVLPGPDPVVLIWFRAEQVEEINWAGNPHDGVKAAPRLSALTPRKSFATWCETVRGRSRPWTAAEIEAAQSFGQRAGYILQQQQIYELNQLLRDAAARLAALAATDELTGLANRRAFESRLAQEWGRAARAGTSLALVAVDIDFFKQYNDHLGHLAGDECLRQVAQVLRTGWRAGDVSSRTGGEEFCLLLPETNLEGAVAVAEAVRCGVEARRIVHPASPMGVVTVSIGVAAARPGGSINTETLWRGADDALYEAKRNGRNRVANAPASQNALLEP